MQSERTDDTPQPPTPDALGRPLRNLRISVTDRCNLRCSYCMPEDAYRWLPRRELLTFEEIASVVDALTACGVQRVRLTGGEPLLRRDLSRLVELLAERDALEDIALTTNGLRLAAQAADLRRAGLRRVTVSLDTLRPDRYAELTRRDGLAQALGGVEAAAAAGFESVKLNTVVMRGRNDDEVTELVEYGRTHGVEVRFIEYMDVGGATRWSPADVVSRDEILGRIAERFGPIEEVRPGGDHRTSVAASAPAQRYRLADGTTVGVIASTTAPFCQSCDRTRLTADGRLFTCLYARDGHDLREPLRAGASSAELAERVRGIWRVRVDRGAEERLALEDRGALADASELAADPHREMHTRGG